MYARDLRLPSGAPLVRLHAGQANDLRADARAGHLVCPIDGCADPRLTTRAGSRRDHFAHLRAEGGGHGPETLAHHTAKHLLADWLRRRHPDAQVYPDTRDVEDGQRPDVLVELSAGTQVAYEVQFAALTPQEWTRRHERYAEAGIRDVWLFGGHRYDRGPAWVQDSAGDQERYRVLVPLFPHVLARRHPLLLIDPERDRVGLGTGHDVEQYLAWEAVDAPTATHQVEVIWCPLEEARSVQGVIELPGMRAMMVRARQRHGAEAAARARHRAWCREQSARAQAALDRHQVSVGEWTQRRTQHEAEHGPLPPVIDQEPGDGEEYLPLAPALWRLRVLDALEQHAGCAVDPSDLHRLVCDRPAGTERVHSALNRFLRELKRAGWVWFAGKRGPRQDEAVIVFATRETLPDEADAHAVGRAVLAAGGDIGSLTLSDPETGRVLWERRGWGRAQGMGALGSLISSGRRGRLFTVGLHLPAPGRAVAQSASSETDEPSGRDRPP
ncbi:MAG: competence protein CoiA family protein [Motilibacteraceae bacterium]